MTRTIGRVLASASAAGVVATAVLGLWVTPPDVNMGQLVRLLYVHPSVAWVCYLAFGVTALASVAYLWPRTRSRFWDRIAVSSAEIGVVFAALTLATGSIWGRPTWGVWWTWDARLTSTALLAALYVGYLALRRVTTDADQRARRGAIAALIAFLDVPIDHLSVVWWRTLHQPATVLRPQMASPTVSGAMAWTMLLSFVSFTGVYAWMLWRRYQVTVLEERLEDEGMAVALASRWAEAAPPAPPSGGVEVPAGAVR